MPVGEREVDANFYNLIHQLAVSARTSAAVDRREDRREPFHALQRIALRRGRDIPDEAEFVEVQCRDLTRCGFSFLLPSPPSFESLVVAFGARPDVIYLAAQVTHCEDVLIYTSEPAGRAVVPAEAQGVGEVSGGRTATPMVLVGCRFTERLARG